MCLGECEIRSKMSLAFSLATYPICLKARPYWFACSSSSISSCCSSKGAARPAQCWGTADIFISCLVQQACVRGQTEGAGVISLDWMCCGGLARHRWTLCEHGHAVQTQSVNVCSCMCMYNHPCGLLKAVCGKDIVNRPHCHAGIDWQPPINQSDAYHQCVGHNCNGWLKPIWTMHTFKWICFVKGISILCICFSLCNIQDQIIVLKLVNPKNYTGEYKEEGSVVMQQSLATEFLALLLQYYRGFDVSLMLPEV